MEKQLSETLSAVAKELGALAKLTMSLQDHLSGVSSACEKNITEMQALDWLTQSLSCLEAFLDQVHVQILLGSQRIPEEVFESICLSRLKERLRGNLESAEPRLDEECEMF